MAHGADPPEPSKQAGPKHKNQGKDKLQEKSPLKIEQAVRHYRNHHHKDHHRFTNYVLQQRRGVSFLYYAGTAVASSEMLPIFDAHPPTPFPSSACLPDAPAPVTAATAAAAAPFPASINASYVSSPSP